MSRLRRCYTRQFFLQLVPQFRCAIARQIARNIAVLRGSLREVEPTSTSRNDCGNKKVARRSFQGMLHWTIFPATFIATKLRDNLQKRLPSVTTPICMTHKMNTLLKG